MFIVRKKRELQLWDLLLVAIAIILGKPTVTNGSRLRYPDVRRDLTIIDDYYGTKIADPYRWLEDSDSEETHRFIQQQQNLTESFLEQIPSRQIIHERLSSVWNFPRSSAPQKICGKYYTFENTGLQNQNVLCVRNSLSDDDEPHVFLDPNKFSKDGTVALDSSAFSKNGELYAYVTSQSGSDWKQVRFLNVSSLHLLPDVLLYSKWPALSWSHDHKGVFYTRFPAQFLNSSTTKNLKIYYHKVGTSQENDILVAEFPKYPKRYLELKVSHCGAYLIITGRDNYVASTIHIVSLKNGVDQTLKKKLIPVFPDPDEAVYTYVANEGSAFVFVTSKDAPNKKIIKVNVDVNSTITDFSTNGTEIGRYTLISTLMKEDTKKVITWTLTVDTDKFLACYLDDVKHTLELRSLRNGTLLHRFDLPAGVIFDYVREDYKDFEFFFRLENFVTPGIIYRCTLRDDQVNCTVLKQLAIPNVDVEQLITDQIFYPSKDGTHIPMYILRKKNLVLDGNTPALLFGYGGYSIPMLPKFSVSSLAFVSDFNGIYVVANIRGGGEYGEKWHVAGSMLNKQNSFDDFHAAAEYLIINKYTSPSKLTIKGESNGGLLVAACVNQRPELFGAAIATVGVMDMLRFQKFTVGYAWCSEFGCSDNKTQFENLIKFSPLHNIRVPTDGDESVQYPAILVATADHDDRVVPAHSFKYIAELQHTIGQSSRQSNPLLLRVDSKAGHGDGKPILKVIEEFTDAFSFLAETLKLTFFPGN